ncbi:MAG: HlyD family efflux transporter periplasmic adaptor subunit [bacterium]
MNKKKIIFIVGIILAIIFAFIYYFYQGDKEDINTAEVERGSIEKFIEETGEVASKNIRSYYGNGSNEVEEILIEVGDEIKKGDLILQYKNTIDLEKEKIEKQIQGIEATYNEAVAGADFEKINTAKLEIEGIKNRLELAEENLETTKELYEKDAATEKEYKEAKNSVEQLENNLKIGQNQYNLLIKGLSANTKKKYESEIEVLAISLKILEENKEKFNIYADFDGIITELDTFEGDIPIGGKKIIEFQESNNLRVYVDFIVEEAIKISEDMQVEIYNDDINLNIKNLKIEKIYPKAISKLSELGVEQKRVTVEIKIPENQNDLILGSKVTARIKTDSKKDILIIPEEAIYEKNKIMFLGDSVTYGGSYIDNSELFSYLSTKKVDNLIDANCAVNAWGVENIYGLIVQKKFLPASIYITPLIEGDFYRGRTRIEGSNFWCKEPGSALEELIQLFIYKTSVKKLVSWNSIATEADKELVAEEAVIKLKEMDSFLMNNGYKHIILISPTMKQTTYKTGKDRIIQRLLQKHNVEVVYLLDKLKTKDFKDKNKIYHDGVHLSKYGHKVWASLIEEEIRGLI